MSHPPDPSYATPRPVETRLGTVWLTDEGEGPLVLAIPGLPGSHRDFRWMAPPMARYCRFARIDMPGFGMTPLRRGVRPQAAWRADLVAAVADALEAPRFAAIAHSMSGPVLASLASRHRDRVIAAGFVACGGTRPHALWRQMPISPPMLSEVLAHPTRARLLAPLTRAWFGHVGFSTKLSDTAITTAIHCVAATDFAAMRRDLARVIAPCLVAHADDDALIDAPIADEIAASVGAVAQLRPRQGGHALGKTWAVELAQALRPLVLETLGEAGAITGPARTDRRSAPRAATRD